MAGHRKQKKVVIAGRKRRRRLLMAHLMLYLAVATLAFFVCLSVPHLAKTTFSATSTLADVKVDDWQRIFFIVIVGLSVIGCFTLLTVTNLVSPKLRRIFIDSFGKAQFHLPWELALVFSFCLIVGAVNCLLYLLPWMRHYPNVIGVLAAVISASFGVAAALVTIWTVRDNMYRYDITSFDNFFERFQVLIEDARESSDEDNFVRVIAYTPLPGGLGVSSSSRRHQKRYETLKQLIYAADQCISVICLNAADLEKWMNSFANKTLSNGEKLDQAAIEQYKKDVEDYVSEMLMAHRGNAARNNRHIQADGADFDEDKPYIPIRGPMALMPNFFAYFSNDRALVMNPMFNPLESVAATKQPKHLRETAVVFIGFETSDGVVIEKLKELYRLTATQILAVQGEHADRH